MHVHVHITITYLIKRLQVLCTIDYSFYEGATVIKHLYLSSGVHYALLLSYRYIKFLVHFHFKL